MPKIFKDKRNQTICTVYETDEIQANPEILGNEQDLTSIQIGSTKYKVEGGGGGSTVIPNPENIGSATALRGLEVDGTKYKVSTVTANSTVASGDPTLTSLTIDGTKYKVPQGGGGGGSDYTAGDGIEIAEDVISVDRESVQKKLVAGDNIEINPIYVGDTHFEQIEAEDWQQIDGLEVWTDGENVYCSLGADSHYILDKATSTWVPKTWSGLTGFSGDGVWTDGENIYYSEGEECQYVLDKATSTWVPKTWSGFTDFYGDGVWTDGENIYYSGDLDQYILDKATSTWSPKTWDGLTDPDLAGAYIWTDGENIYDSRLGSQYVLDKATSTWVPKTWSGIDASNFLGNYIWTDGENTYYSDGDQYVLDKATSTWVPKTWSGLTGFPGDAIWTDGENTYFSLPEEARGGASGSYILIKGEVDPNTEEISFSSSLTDQDIKDLFSEYLDSNASFVEDTDPETSETNYILNIPKNASYEANETGYTLVVDTDDANLENDTAVFGEN